MDLDTIWDLTIKQNELVAFLLNNQDLPSYVIDVILNKIDELTEERDMLKSKKMETNHNHR